MKKNKNVNENSGWAGKIERPGRELKIDNNLVGNSKVSVKVGTTDNKNAPGTVYIVITYWVDVRDKNNSLGIHNYDNYISKNYGKEIHKIHKVTLKDILIKNKYFPHYYDNIFVWNFPDNLNYNKKKSFTHIELTLNTLNCNPSLEGKLPLKNKLNSEIYDELIKIARIMCNTDLLKGKLGYKISKTKD